MAEATADDIATLIYTSGTTGPPKGAMLSVSNVEFGVKTLVDGRRLHLAAAGPARPDAVLPAAVPRGRADLHHLVQRRRRACRCNFAESIATVQPNLREVQPTILFGVPRIWEKILAAVRSGLATASWLKRANSKFWLKAADWIGATLVRTGGRHTVSTRLLYAIGWLFFYRALRSGSACAGCATPRRARPRSRPRCCSSSWASACRCTRSTA